MLAFIHWNVNPNIPLPVHFFSIQWYGLMWTISILGSFFIGRWLFKIANISEEYLVALVMLCCLGTQC